MGLIGRTRELTVITAGLTRAEGGVGGIVVVVGPRGAGKSAVAAAALGVARGRGFRVLQVARVAGQRDGVVWAQLLSSAGVDQDIAGTMLAPPSALTSDTAVQALITAGPQLLVVEDVDATGMDVAMVSLLAGRVTASGTLVLVTARSPFGFGTTLTLRGLGLPDTGRLLPGLAADALRAVWLVSGGLPGRAIDAADHLAEQDDGVDPLVHLVMQATSATSFLVVDWDLVGMLEAALPRVTGDAQRARLQAKLARELLGDPPSLSRRRELIDGAVLLARRSGDRQALAVALEARAYALWDQKALEDRLAAAREIVDLAGAAHDGPLRRTGLFWRFIGLVELGRIDEAESTLAAFARAADAAGDAAAAVMVTARHVMLATLRGRFEEATRLAREVAAAAHRCNMPDADALIGSLQVGLAIVRGEMPGESDSDALAVAIRSTPGHLLEASAARVFALRGEHARARAEIDRILLPVLIGSGPRWLSAAADLAVAVVLESDTAAAARLYQAMLPFDGRLVVQSGASRCSGSVAFHLGLLATSTGDLPMAVRHFQDAARLEQAIGALPFLAGTLAELADVLTRPGVEDHRLAGENRSRANELAQLLDMPGLLGRLRPGGDEWALRRDGDDWLLDAGAEHIRLRHGRGLQYLRDLLAAGGREISALDLAAGGPGLAERSVGPVVDDAARAAYRVRLDRLAVELDDADAVGDQAAAIRAEDERQAILAELSRGQGLAGRSRYTSPEAERARVNVTRALRATVDRIGTDAPLAAAHLRASLRTGRHCRYEAAAGGPSRWRV